MPGSMFSVNVEATARYHRHGTIQINDLDGLEVLTAPVRRYFRARLPGSPPQAPYRPGKRKMVRVRFDARSVGSRVVYNP